MDIEKWKNVIEMARRQKDAFFGSYQSPISFDEKENFKGLHYYPPDIKYRFELELGEYTEKDTLKIKDTKGNIRDFIRFGEFRFNIDETNCKLQAYKSELQEERLFIPFKDSTTGKETYPAGRYLDMESGSYQLPDGRWILDFNTAYNPWCAYSENYSCPLTPAENILDVEVCAGEKNYPHENK